MGLVVDGGASGGLVDGAEHLCMSLGACQPTREYTCEECIEGMEWIEAYFEDPIFQVEALLWLELNWCDDEKPMCIPTLQEHFVPMHVMAMEKFMIPVEICNEEPVCGGATHDPPTVPPHY